MRSKQLLESIDNVLAIHERSWGPKKAPPGPPPPPNGLVVVFDWKRVRISGDEMVFPFSVYAGKESPEMRIEAHAALVLRKWSHVIGSQVDIEAAGRLPWTVTWPGNSGVQSKDHLEEMIAGLGAGSGFSQALKQGISGVWGKEVIQCNWPPAKSNEYMPVLDLYAKFRSQA